MIPLASTTISVLRGGAGDDDEPYAGGSVTTLTTGVRAVIDPSSGREQVAGGEQVIWDVDLVCDLTDLVRTDSVLDESTGVSYRVVWLHTYPGDHIEAGLRYVAGEV